VPKRGRAKKKFFHFIRDVSFDVQIASVTVEMQIQGQTDYLARAITYLTSLYESSVDISVKTPTRYGTAKPAWSMNILDHTMFGDDQRALRILTFKDEDGKEALVKTSPFGSSMFRVEADSGYLQPPLKLGFFELSKPAPTPNLAAWQQLFKTGEAPAAAPRYIHDGAALVNRANLPDEVIEMLDFETRQKWERAAQLDYAKNEGRNEGITIGEARGEARGRNDERREMAQTLLRKGQSPEFVSEVTGIPVKDLRPSSHP
jgi:predicted transposase/invertase (TIGR01784 family)